MEENVPENDDGDFFRFSYSEKLYIMILIGSWYLGREHIHISKMN